MIRNPEQTIGKLVDNVRYGFGSFMDEPGYPETQVLPHPLRRKGIRDFWFEIDPDAGCFEIDFTERPAGLYFIDQRFYRGVCLKGFFQIEEFSDIKDCFRADRKIWASRFNVRKPAIHSECSS